MKDIPVLQAQDENTSGFGFRKFHNFVINDSAL